MKTLLIFLGSIALVLILGIVMAFPTMWLWNWLIPTIFGLIKINVWQAWGLIVLCGILFKGATAIKK